jgi:hypothetical protein
VAARCALTLLTDDRYSVGHPRRRHASANCLSRRAQFANAICFWLRWQAASSDLRKPAGAMLRQHVRNITSATISHSAAGPSAFSRSLSGRRLTSLILHDRFQLPVGFFQLPQPGISETSKPRTSFACVECRIQLGCSDSPLLLFRATALFDFNRGENA